MSHVLHVFKKDMRRLRWATVAWIAVVVARLILMTAGAELSFDAVGLQYVVGTVSDLLQLIEILLLALIVSGLVHDEPLVGADAFWLTRPIGARTLLAAKLSFAALFLVCAPMVGEVMADAAISRSLQTALRAAPAFILTQALWVSLLLALAALTPSVTRFSLMLVGSVAAAAVGLSLFFTIAVLAASEDGFADSMLLDPTSGVMLKALVTCVALVVVVYQYRKRRVGRAATMAVVGLVGAVLISDMWPWRFAKAAEPDPGSWALDVAATPAVLDVSPRVSDTFGISRAESRKDVAAPVRLVGMPSSYSADTIGMRTHVDFPDGAAIESRQASGLSVQLPVAEPSDRIARLGSTVGNARMLPAEAGRFGTWPIVLRITDQEYERYGRVPGRLTATVDFFLNQSRLVGTIPLAAQATLQDGSRRFELLRVLRRPDGFTVLVRRTAVGSLSRPSVPKQYEFVLRNTARGEALFGSLQPLSNPGLRLGNLFMRGAYSVDTGETAFGFDFGDLVAQFPAPGPTAVEPPIDAAWLDGAELVVIETAYAGRVRRSLTVDGFRMR